MLLCVLIAIIGRARGVAASRLVTACGAVLGLSACLVVWERAAPGRWWSRRVGVPPEMEAAQIFQELHRGIYRAFEARTEDEIYDTLARFNEYEAYYRVRSAILVVCLSIAIFLPAAVHLLVGRYNRIMIERADRTPLVIGAHGSVYDLVLSTLYFKGRLRQHLSMAHVDVIRDGGLATPVPLYVRFTAGGQPIVGTTLDYFPFRELRARHGTLPQVLGDVVLGAAAARRLVGVLEESGSADDLVIFADVKTTWIIEGIGHGHLDARSVTDPAMLRGASQDNLVMSGAVVLASTVLFLLLVMLLSLRIRRQEFQTLHKIGCSRSTVFALYAAEITLLLTASLAVAGAAMGGLVWYVVRFDVLL